MDTLNNWFKVISGVILAVLVFAAIIALMTERTDLCAYNTTYIIVENGNHPKVSEVPTDKFPSIVTVCSKDHAYIRDLAKSDHWSLEFPKVDNGH